MGRVGERPSDSVSVTHLPVEARCFILQWAGETNDAFSINWMEAILGLWFCRDPFCSHSFHHYVRIWWSHLQIPSSDHEITYCASVSEREGKETKMWTCSICWWLGILVKKDTEAAKASSLFSINLISAWFPLGSSVMERGSCLFLLGSLFEMY